MNRQQFNSRNNIGQVLTFQKSGSTSAFDPSLSYSAGTPTNRRVSWRLNNGTTTQQIGGNFITYTGFTSDSAIRSIQMRGSDFEKIVGISIDNDNLFGGLDLSLLKNLSAINLNFNPRLTGITVSPSSVNFNTFVGFQAQSCNLTGNLNVPLSGLGGIFQVNNNSQLTGITHVPSSQNFTNYWAYSCNLTGNLNVPLSGLGGIFQVYSNPQLTGITHVPSSQNFTVYYAYQCNLTGNLNLPFSGLGGFFQVQNNSQLTGITHVPSSQNFTVYYAYQCNLTGNLNLPFSGLGGDFQIRSNTGLTSVTHVSSNQNFTVYSINNCNITGNLDLTPLSGLGGILNFHVNPNLTGITYPISNNYFTYYQGYSCNLTGTLDVSPLINLGGSSVSSPGIFRVNNNTNLTNVLFPTTSGYFRNLSNIENSGTFVIYSCNLDYVDFKPLSGATLLTGSTQGNPRISLRDNGMIADDVNHILVDFSGNATFNPTGWSNVNLNIGGTNADPDSSSGGYNGLAAISFLTGSPYNWTITY